MLVILRLMLFMLLMLLMLLMLFMLFMRLMCLMRFVLMRFPGALHALLELLCQRLDAVKHPERADTALQPTENFLQPGFGLTPIAEKEIAVLHPDNVLGRGLKAMGLGAGRHK